VFKKFFGKKNDGFYMQIEDDAPAKVEAKAKPAATVVAAPPAVAATPTATVAAPVAVTATPTATIAVSTAVTATPTATVAAPAAVGATPTPLTPAEKKIADAEKAVAKAAAKAEKKAAKKAVDEKKVAAVASAAVAPAPALPPITNFATDYLIKPSSDSTRRRPGANMSKFLELAREAKIPVNIKK
jgi:hypothetical protein